jgi:hypothetical protein
MNEIVMQLKQVVKRFIIIFIPPLLLATPACAAMRYTAHPGAVSVADSAAYDRLRVAEAVIDQARLDLQAGKLPASARKPLNALITSYNVARASWLAYRDSAPPGTEADRLDRGIADLVVSMKAFKAIKEAP